MATYNYAAVQPVVMVPNVCTGQSVPMFVAPQSQARPTGDPVQPVSEPITDDDIKQIKEMFPNIDEEVIQSVLTANRGIKQAAINSLLQMSGQ